MRISTSSCLFGSSTVLALGCDSRHIGAIIIQFVQIDFVVKAYTVQY